MQNEYYYLGNSLGMARLHGSNALICVDTRSWEALSYIQGHPVEPMEISVMKRFLSTGDVFLDIGANFGLYSMVASQIIGAKGKVYSFEANPHTYQYLRHSAIANRLIWLPNYKWENLAIADTSGDLEFAFQPNNLGGGHIRNSNDTAETQTIITVPATTIDAYLASDQPVDFVKIDVEGHEPSVLMGMTETVARSPSIRIMMEYYTYSDEITEYGRNVIATVRSLGLGLCAVNGDGTLSVVADGEIPTGNLYLLATRTPEEDCRHPGSAITIRPKGLHYHAIFADGLHALLGTDGVLRYEKAKHADVEEPALCFGPYIGLVAGTYSLTAQAEMEGVVDLSLTTALGHNVILSKRVNTWAKPIVFHLAEAVENFEIVLRRTSSLEKLYLHHMTLESK